MRVYQQGADIRITWNEDDRRAFASRWPCCDVPRKGSAIFDNRGDLVDLHAAGSRDCEPSGGMSEFLDDLQAWARVRLAKTRKAP